MMLWKMPSACFFQQPSVPMKKAPSGRTIVDLGFQAISPTAASWNACSSAVTIASMERPRFWMSRCEIVITTSEALAEEAIAQLVAAHGERKEQRSGAHERQRRQGSLEDRTRTARVEDLRRRLEPEERRHRDARAAAAEDVLKPVLDAKMGDPVRGHRELAFPAMCDLDVAEARKTIGEVAPHPLRLGPHVAILPAGAG